MEETIPYCITSPSINDSAKILSKLVEKKSWIALMARCEIEYEGRGASKSSLGDRLIIIKPSGSIIVHGPKGFKPENWQPDNSSVSVSEKNNHLHLVSIRRSPREKLIIKIYKIFYISSLDDYIEGEFVMYFSESEIRDYLAQHPEEIENGLRIIRIEKPVEPGFIDLYGVDKNNNIVVIEIKRVKAGEDAIRQLLRYLEALRKHGINARGVLVAPGFSESAVRLAYQSKTKLVPIDLSRLRDKIMKTKPRKKSLFEYF